MDRKLFLSQIFFYPIKSLGGISLKSAIVEKEGLRFDRRWMLVDKNNIFLTQRVLPQMALLQVEILNQALVVKHKTKEITPLAVPIKNDSSNFLRVKIWEDDIDAKYFNDDINLWFSNALNKKCKLVYLPKKSRKRIDSIYAKQNYEVSLADAYPFLLIGQASLDDLNSRLIEPLPVNRFRPNFVFAGGEAFEEDTWNRFQIGKITFRAVKPCSRCIITTTNQDTAERKDEPLKTLSTYRKVDGKVLFGQNLICENEGEVKVGNEITLID
ncbi:MAG: MOSC domain-containing protein [Ignavibacteria bacterium]|nr:MOSC domain-containing protein [Ignavibacteria bacterium]